MSGGAGQPSLATMAQGHGFDTMGHRVLIDSDTVDAVDGWRNRLSVMEESHALYAIRHSDGSVSLYVDEAYAIERGAEPAHLHCVEVPRQLYATGTVQQIQEYVASYLEAQTTGTA